MSMVTLSLQYDLTCFRTVQSVTQNSVTVSPQRINSILLSLQVSIFIT